MFTLGPDSICFPFLSSSSSPYYSESSSLLFGFKCGDGLLIPIPDMMIKW